MSCLRQAKLVLCCFSFPLSVFHWLYLTRVRVRVRVGALPASMSRGLQSTGSHGGIASGPGPGALCPPTAPCACRFNMFMRDLLTERAKDIFRCKGILAVHVRDFSGPCLCWPCAGMPVQATAECRARSGLSCAPVLCALASAHTPGPLNLRPLCPAGLPRQEVRFPGRA